MLADGRYTRVFDADDTVEKRRVVLKFPKAITGAEDVLRDAFLREAWIAARIRSPWIGEDDRAVAGAPDRALHRDAVLRGRDARAPAVAPAPPVADRGPRLCDQARRRRRGAPPGRHHPSRHQAGQRDPRGDPRPPGPRAAADRPRRRAAAAHGGHPRAVRAGNAELHGAGAVRGRAPATSAPTSSRSGSRSIGCSRGNIPTARSRRSRIRASSGRRRSTKHRPDLPAWLDEALARATAADPDDRFGDVFEFIFALEHGAIRAAPPVPRPPAALRAQPAAGLEDRAALLALALGVRSRSTRDPARAPGAGGECVIPGRAKREPGITG